MRVGRLVAAAGAVVAVAVPLGWWVSHDAGPGPATRAGTAVLPTDASAHSTGPAAATVPPSVVASPATPTAVGPSVPTIAGDPGAVSAPAVATPVRLQVPSLGIDAPVDVVGLDADGAMALPDQVDRVGWYRFGASPASAHGATVVAGHVDDAVQGVGAMFDLGSAELGAVVQLSTDDGAVHAYRVVGRERFSKHDVPLDTLFSTAGPPRLVLITCGGEFDRAARSYEDNVVVTATPV